MAEEHQSGTVNRLAEGSLEGCCGQICQMFSETGWIRQVTRYSTLSHLSVGVEFAVNLITLFNLSLYLDYNMMLPVSLCIEKN